MRSMTVTALLAVLGAGAVLTFLFFVSGLGSGLRASRQPGPTGHDAPPGRGRLRRRVDAVRGLILVTVVCIFAGVFLGRPVLLVIGLVSLALAYAAWRLN